MRWSLLSFKRKDSNNAFVNEYLSLGKRREYPNEQSYLFMYRYIWIRYTMRYFNIIVIKRHTKLDYRLLSRTFCPTALWINGLRILPCAAWPSFCLPFLLLQFLQRFITSTKIAKVPRNIRYKVSPRTLRLFLSYSPHSGVSTPQRLLTDIRYTNPHLDSPNSIW